MTGCVVWLTRLSIGYRLTPVHHSPDYPDLDAVVGSTDGRPPGASIVVGAAEASSVGDGSFYFVTHHADTAGVVGWDGELH